MTQQAAPASDQQFEAFDPESFDPSQFDTEKYGPWAVIAGGSEGVGAEFADLLAQAGLNLVLLARKAAPLEETAERVRAHGVEVRTLSVDLTDPVAVTQIAELTADLEVGLFVNNAGANTYGSEFVMGDLEKFQSVIDLNITSQLALVQLFGRPMRERKRGGLILVGSMSGYMGSATMSIYGGVKAFVRIFAEAVWLEMREHNVDVLELVLGVTRTPAMARGGLNMDIPGLNVAEPVNVAREGLAKIADGPVQIAAGNAKGVSKRIGMDRAAVVLGAHEAMQRLLPKNR